MRIGILTFVRTINYGALLQCYALQEVLRSLGHEVEVIDYCQPYVELDNALISWHRVCTAGSIISALRYVKNVKYRYPLWHRRNLFRQNYLRLTQTCSARHIPQNFDLYLIGSDQLWSTQYAGGIDPVFWGNFHRSTSSRVSTYAVSTSVKSLQSLSSAFIHERFCTMESVSVREATVRDFIDSELSIEARVDIDPTLLAGVEVWKPFVEKGRVGGLFSGNKEEWSNVIVMYQVRRLSWERNHLREHAQKLANEQGCMLLDLSDYQLTADEFVCAISHCRAMVTTSFHGLVFSLLFHRPFVAYALGDGHDGRLQDILESVGLAGYLQSIDTPAMLKEPDFSVVESHLDALRKQSMDYLKSL